MEVNCLSHILDTKALWSKKGKTSPLTWLEAWWNQQEGCGKPGLCHEQCMNACFLLKQGGKGGLSLHTWLTHFL